MKRCLIFAALLLAFANVTSAYPGIGKLSMDQTAIAAIFEGYAKYAAACDVEGFMSIWDVDGIKMAHGKPAVIGKANIYEQTKKNFDGTRGKFDKVMELNLEEIVVAGDYAFARGTYISSLTPKNGGASSITDGKFVTVLRRQADGSWLIYRDIPNSNVPTK